MMTSASSVSCDDRLFLERTSKTQCPTRFIRLLPTICRRSSLRLAKQTCLWWSRPSFLLVSVLLFGVLFLTLHTLPERMAHKSHKLQFEIVAVLGLLALFTHIHLFWVAGLLLALIDIPDFGGSLGRIAGIDREDRRKRARTGRPRQSPKPSRTAARQKAGRRRATADAAMARHRRRRPSSLRQAQGAIPCLRFFSARC